MSQEPEWQSPVPEAAEAIGAEDISVNLGTRHGFLRSEGLGFAGMDLWTHDGRVGAGIVTTDDDTEFAFRMTAKQARAWATALEVAADYAERGEGADIV